MKKLFCLLLALAGIMTFALAEEAYVFSFRGVFWGAAPEEVTAAECLPPDYYRQQDSTGVVFGEGYQVGDYLFMPAYGFYENRLTVLEMMLSGSYSDPAKTVAEIAEVLSADYGEPNCHDYSLVKNVFTFFGAVSIPTEEEFNSGYTWLLPDGKTVVFLAYMTGGIGMEIFNSAALATE